MKIRETRTATFVTDNNASTSRFTSKRHKKVDNKHRNVEITTVYGPKGSPRQDGGREGKIRHFLRDKWEPVTRRRGKVAKRRGTNSLARLPFRVIYPCPDIECCTRNQFIGTRPESDNERERNSFCSRRAAVETEKELFRGTWPAVHTSHDNCSYIRSSRLLSGKDNVDRAYCSPKKGNESLWYTVSFVTRLHKGSSKRINERRALRPIRSALDLRRSRLMDRLSRNYDSYIVSDKSIFTIKGSLITN